MKLFSAVESLVLASDVPTQEPDWKSARFEISVLEDAIFGSPIRNA